jgi:hypothetical protein
MAGPGAKLGPVRVLLRCSHDGLLECDFDNVAGRFVDPQFAGACDRLNRGKLCERLQQQIERRALSHAA